MLPNSNLDVGQFSLVAAIHILALEPPSNIFSFEAGNKRQITPAYHKVIRTLFPVGNFIFV